MLVKTVNKARDPISAKLNVALQELADRVLTMDLHVPQIQGFLTFRLTICWALLFV